MESLVLLSGGLDSAVLLAHEAQHARVHPLYVSVGLAWEAAERATIAKLLTSAILDGHVAPLSTVEFSMRDVYSPNHWAIRGMPPSYDTPDEDVYLAGRNLVLLTKAGIVAAARKIERVALGPLAGNPFPDATPEFFAAMAKALSLGLNHEIGISTPFASLHKEDVIKLGARLRVPFEHTLSCMNPVSTKARKLAKIAKSNLIADDGLSLHCGLCSKCRERRDAFAAASVADPTEYANRSPRLRG